MNEDYCMIFKFPYFSHFYKMFNTIYYRGWLEQHEPCYNKNTWLNFKYLNFQTLGWALGFLLRGSKARPSVWKGRPITFTEILHWSFWSKGTLIIFENMVCKKQSTFIGIYWKRLHLADLVSQICFELGDLTYSYKCHFFSTFYFFFYRYWLLNQNLDN